MKTVVGLGNPGSKYEGTRHNVGFRVIEELARRMGADLRRSWRMPLRMAEGELTGAGPVRLVEPQTFMNASGEAVAALVRRKGLTAGDLVLVFDDVDLPVGRLRLRPGGGAGGHNGVRSVMEHLGGGTFGRVRLGVGRGAAEKDLVEHVLSGFTPTERPVVEEMVSREDEVEPVRRHVYFSGIGQGRPAGRHDRQSPGGN
jgi:PTH1 family peptidyl-tRNA hydrolase